MLVELQWPSLEARRDMYSLFIFYKIHCGTMHIDKDKYLAPLTEQNSPGHHIIPGFTDPRHIVIPKSFLAETTEEFRELI